jgi:Uma2 family endonuclease
MTTGLEPAASVLGVDDAPLSRLGPEMNGMTMTAEEFRAIEECEPGYRYELIHGVLIVSPPPDAGERGSSDELNILLRQYQTTHPNGRVVDGSLPEQELETSAGIRRADRVIWIGLGRRPVPETDIPTIVVEFVSNTFRDRRRDYEEKRNEYADIGVSEYWIIDRFRRTMTVCRGRQAPQLLVETEKYSTPLMPGFELSLAHILAEADGWSS